MNFGISITTTKQSNAGSSGIGSHGLEFMKHHVPAAASVPVHENSVQVPLDVIKAKRREVQQRLESLLFLQSTSNGNGNSSTTNTPATDQLLLESEGFQRVDSSDWLAFSSLMTGSASGRNASSSNSMSNTMAPVPPLVGSSSVQTPRVVSAESLNFVYSDRLSEVLPDLEMDQDQVPDDEDHLGIMQFFQDSDAWLMPSETTSSSFFHTITPPAMVRKVSSGSGAGSDTTSSSKTSRKKRTHKAASKRKLGRPSAFPQKLHTMLTAIQTEDSHLADIVRFVPDGSAFEIQCTEAFAEKILPKYFKMSSFSSFQRQLQLYNFKRVTKGGAYRHPLFHRDLPENLNKMVRKQSKPSHFVLSIAAKSA